MLGIGIVGLPNVGKSTLFNAITKAGVEAANYPFATIDKNVGVVSVPDERLGVLVRLNSKGDRSPVEVPTHVEFVDIAGLVQGAHKGEGLGNQFLAHIREVAAIATWCAASTTTTWCTSPAASTPSPTSRPSTPS